MALQRTRNQLGPPSHRARSSEQAPCRSVRTAAPLTQEEAHPSHSSCSDSQIKATLCTCCTTVCWSPVPHSTHHQHWDVLLSGRSCYPEQQQLWHPRPRVQLAQGNRSDTGKPEHAGQPHLHAHPAGTREQAHRPRLRDGSRRQDARKATCLEAREA